MYSIGSERNQRDMMLSFSQFTRNGAKEETYWQTNDNDGN
jgi:hypothetical protein